MSFMNTKNNRGTRADPGKHQLLNHLTQKNMINIDLNNINKSGGTLG
jgi:hypothetical protein